ncbi:hypothetical protein [Kutzneria kofuensis]|uniref:hypothetical protein n=1 Tax=Kutzneria kofuensis TaxID=103725 RepID=UPI0031E56D4F
MTEHAVPAAEFYTDEFAADPYPAYARLREERPVCPVSSPRFDSYLITRLDDARAALTDPGCPRTSTVPATTTSGSSGRIRRR